MYSKLSQPRPACEDRRDGSVIAIPLTAQLGKPDAGGIVLHSTRQRPFCLRLRIPKVREQEDEDEDEEDEQEEEWEEVLVECQSAAEQERWKGEIQQHALMVSYHTSSGFMLAGTGYARIKYVGKSQSCMVYTCCQITTSQTSVPVATKGWGAQQTAAKALTMDIPRSVMAAMRKRQVTVATTTTPTAFLFHRHEDCFSLLVRR
eukprot:COSAG05_NODE_704_length_7857_cov_2.807038_2_plen_204_part_00